MMPISLMLLTTPLLLPLNNLLPQESPLIDQPKSNAPATPIQSNVQGAQRKQGNSPPQDPVQHKDSSKPINIEPSAENVVKSDTDDSSTDSKQPWDPERAKRKHMKTKKLLKELRRTQATFLSQQSQAMDKGTRNTSKDMEVRRSRSKSPTRSGPPRYPRSRSPPRIKRERSSSPTRQSRSPPRATSRSHRSAPPSSQEERPPTKGTTARRSPPSSHRTRHSPPRSTPFTSQTNQYAKSYFTTAQGRSHQR